MVVVYSGGDDGAGAAAPGGCGAPGAHSTPGGPSVHSVLSLGVDVCGHPRIVHGGLTSAVFDET
jgi:hypothetical protein